MGISTVYLWTWQLVGKQWKRGDMKRDLRDLRGKVRGGDGNGGASPIIIPRYHKLGRKEPWWKRSGLVRFLAYWGEPWSWVVVALITLIYHRSSQVRSGTALAASTGCLRGFPPHRGIEYIQARPVGWWPRVLGTLLVVVLLVIEGVMSVCFGLRTLRASRWPYIITS